jgi:glycerophosphoryl diester phosphodiesterase
MPDRTDNPLLRGAKPPLVIAHRGYSARYPENTLPALQAAAEAGADMVEFDVRITGDDHPVVIHDATLDRTTDGSGRLREKSPQELARLDAGSWFGPDFAGCRLPSLKEVLDALAGRCLLNIELKTEPEAFPAEKSALSCAALGLIRSRGLMHRALFSSFDPDLLRLVRRLEPGAMIGLLAADEQGHDAFPFLARELRPSAVHPHLAFLDEALIEDAHERGRLVLVWAPEEMNDEAHMRRALELGADGFFANDVELMKKIAEELFPRP